MKIKVVSVREIEDWLRWTELEHGMTSEQFYERFKLGEFDEPEYAVWASYWEGYLRSDARG